MKGMKNFTIIYLQCDRIIAVKLHEVKCKASSVPPKTK